MSRMGHMALTLAHLGRSTQTRCTASDITPIQPVGWLRLFPQCTSKKASRHALLRLDTVLNGPKIRTLRLQLLTGDLNEHCSMCPVRALTTPANLRIRLERELSTRFQLVVSNEVPCIQQVVGYVDSVFVSRRIVTIKGWGMLQGNDSQVFVNINLPLKMSELTKGGRPDVASALGDPRLAYAGFTVRLHLQDCAPLESIKLRVWTDDSVFGRHLLHIPPKHSWPAEAGLDGFGQSTDPAISRAEAPLPTT
jgi:hypothetical protein